VRLYLQETFTFLLLTSEASVAVWAAARANSERAPSPPPTRPKKVSR
jgi:hypothetical protein